MEKVSLNINTAWNKSLTYLYNLKLYRIRFHFLVQNQEFVFLTYHHLRIILVANTGIPVFEIPH